MSRSKPVRPHLPVLDPTVPRDQHGHDYCLTCQLAIVAGDPRHTLPARAGRDAAELAAGEREDG